MVSIIEQSLKEITLDQELIYRESRMMIKDQAILTPRRNSRHHNPKEEEDGVFSILSFLSFLPSIFPSRLYFDKTIRDYTTKCRCAYFKDLLIYW